jgi:cbb3-type cytochrome oxidase subunit 3
MASSVIGSLRVNLGLDSAQFERGAKKTQPALAGMKAGFLAVGAAAAAMATAIGAMAMRGAADIDRVAKAARRLDATVTGFRALEMVADDAGVSLSSLADNIQTMNREIAKNSAGAQSALRKLGLAASDLDGLDVDQKMAVIADQIAALGLSAADTSVVLQQLGVRNREMALLMLGGGDALRAARADVEDYGLALSQVDARQIEMANDEIKGLGDITMYLGDQLALVIVPALGQFAKALTDSLREGGFLRAVIDGLVTAVRVLWGVVDGLVGAFNLLRTAMDLPERAIRWLFDMGPTALQTQRAIDQLTLSIGDEIRQLAALTGAMGPGVEMTRGMAERKLQEATSRLANIEAMRQEQLELLRQTGAFQTTQIAIDEARATYQVLLDTMSQSNRGPTEEMTAAFRRVGESLTDALARQRELMGEAAELSPEYQAVQAEIERIKQAIEQATGETVTFTGEVVTAEMIAARLADTADTVNFDKARTSAQALAAQLGVSVGLAQQLQGLEARAAGDVVFDPRDPRYDAGAALRARSALGIGQETVSPFDRIARALDGGGGGGGVSGAASSAADEIRKVTENIIESGAASIAAAEAAKEYSDTMTGFVTDGISRAVDWMVDGFKGGLSSLKDMFVATIKQMIAFAIKNRIMISLGMGGSVAGSAAMAGGVGGIGAAVTAAGGVAGLGASFAGGVGSFVSGGVGAIGPALAGASTGLTGLAAAAGTVALPLLAVAAVFSLLNRRAKKKKAAAEAAARAEEALRLAREQAAAVAAAIAGERYGLESQLLALQGNTVELRARELALINPANHELQQLIFSLEDMQAATTAAAEAQQRVTDERLGLEGRLLALQGNTVELRRRELAGLDASNRGLQQMIWSLDDAKAAMDALDPARFASLFDFRVAQGRLASGSPVANSNTPIFSPQLTGSGVTGVAGVDDHRALLIKIEKHTRDTANILQKNDVIGPLPARSVA